MNNKFRDIYIVSACVALFSSCSLGCNQRTDTTQTDTLIIDSIASVVTIDEPTIMAYPDTILSSVKKIDFRVDTFINDVSGNLVQLTDFYKDAPGILTFRGSPSRNMPFSGTVKGTPSKVSVEWVFCTDIDRSEERRVGKEC